MVDFPAMSQASVLVVNAGSSSLKVKELPNGHWVTIERLGRDASARSAAGEIRTPALDSQGAALAFALQHLRGQPGHQPPLAVGHRVVHGGTRYREPTLIDDEVQRAIEELSGLAPLHNPANLEVLVAARELLPDVAHVAVFDTAFHADLPPHAYVYGLPLSFVRQRLLRRYGFHGTSHDYVTRTAAERLGRRREELRMVSLHLGNGVSGTAVANGVSVDTSMGFTPLEGLLMGTRSGDIDPGLLLHLLREGMSVAELDLLLNRGSGLAGMSGVSNDMRDVRAAAAAGNGDALLALAVFSYRIRKLIGAYAAAMGGLDVVVFTGGIGENDVATRAESLAGLGFLGIELDAAANEASAEVISTPQSRVTAMVIRTDEELAIAAQVRAVAGLERGEAA